LSALQSEKTTALAATDESDEKPRRILLCLGQRADETAKLLAKSGYKVYVAQTPAQANERVRDGKTEILIFSPDFAPEMGGAAVIQQKANAMYSSERRRLYLVSLEDGGRLTVRVDGERVAIGDRVEFVEDRNGISFFRKA